MCMKRKTGGYIGLIGLMIGIAVIALLFTKTYLSPRPESEEEGSAQPLSASGTAPTTQIGQMHADVDAANATREMLNRQQRTINASLAE